MPLGMSHQSNLIIHGPEAQVHVSRVGAGEQSLNNASQQGVETFIIVRMLLIKIHDTSNC